MLTKCTITKAVIQAAAVMMLMLPCMEATAKTVPEPHKETITLKIAFRQGDRRIDPNYMGNSESLSVFTSVMQDKVHDSDLTVESVEIIGGASIEGTAELNRDLSNNRAKRMVEILGRFVNVPQNRVNVNSRGVNWEDVLDMVERDYNVPDRGDVITILTTTPEPARKATLEALDGGRPYKYMYDNIFPYVRTGMMTVVFNVVPKHPVASPDTVYVHQTDTIYHVFSGSRYYGDGYYNIGSQHITNINSAEGKFRRRKDGQPGYMERMDSLLRTPVLAFRSNLLAPLMNVGVEVPLGNRWSVAADWYYPWVWRNHEHKNCFELLGGTAEVRYWFGKIHRPDDDNSRYRLLGHSLALIGGAGYYDFQRNWAGYQGEFGMVGLDYLFALPVGKKAGLHLEFDLALGAITMRDIPYDVFTEGGILLHRNGIIKTSHWIGPIKAGVNLVVPIFRKENVPAYADAESNPDGNARKAEASAREAAAKSVAVSGAAAASASGAPSAPLTRTTTSTTTSNGRTTTTTETTTMVVTGSGAHVFTDPDLTQEELTTAKRIVADAETLAEQADELAAAKMAAAERLAKEQVAARQATAEQAAAIEAADQRAAALEKAAEVIETNTAARIATETNTEYERLMSAERLAKAQMQSNK